MIILTGKIYSVFERRILMYVIGMVINNGNINVAVYDKNSYKMVGSSTAAIPDGKSVASFASELCQALLSDTKIVSSDVEYIGVVTDIGFDICAEIEKQTHIKTFAETLLNSRALGEAFFSGDENSLILLSIGENVKNSVVMDKRLFTREGRGENGFAHMVIKSDGLDCACGTKGCFESYVSEYGVKNIAKEVGVNGWQSITVKSLFDMNDSAAQKAQKLYVEYLTMGLTNIINLFQPEELVVDGDFFSIGDSLVGPVMDIVKREQYTKFSQNQCKIRESRNAIDTALIGAALIKR